MPKTTDLSQRSVSAVLWGASGSAVQLILQFGIQVVLARLLGPDQYGLFAIGFVVITFGGFFSNVGIAYGLIQKRTVTDEDVRFVNFWQLLTGSAAAIAVFLLAEPVATFFHEPRVAPVVQAMSVICLLQAATGPSSNLLQRDLDFKTIQFAAVLAYVGGYALIGIPLALSGHGVAALVAAQITQTTLNLAILYSAKRHPLGFVIWYRDASALWRYGLTVFATNMTNWLVMNLSRVVVGRTFPSAAIGLYSLAYNLVLQFANSLMGVLQPALFSAGSRVQDDLGRLRTAFLTMLSATALLVAPVFAGIAAVPETVTLALYGDAWRDGAPLLRPFALAMPFYLLFGMATPMLWTSGRTTQEFKLQLPVCAALAVAAFGAAQYSLVAVAWVVLGIFVLRLAVVLAATCAALKLRGRDLVAACRAGLTVTILVAVTIALMDTLAGRVTDKHLIVLALDAAAGAIAQIAGLRLSRRWFLQEMSALFEILAARLPRQLAPAVESVLLGSKKA